MNMIKKTILSIATVAAFGLSSLATAAVIQDVEAPAQPTQITSTQPFTFIQDILDRGFSVGDALSNAFLTIFLSDPNGGGEKFKFLVGADQEIIYKNDNISEQNGFSTTFALTAASLADLTADGKLTVRVSTEKETSNINDEFYFVSSTFNATLTKAVAPVQNNVPEPASIALLGLGLVGVAASRRKAAKNKTA